MNSEEHDPEDLLGLHPFERLADEFVLKLRRGQSVDIEQIAAEHPEHAEMIRSVFPSLVVVERVSAQDATRSFSPNTEISPPSLSGHPHAFGDFEIVRRIGMGGMGVVYEAIQRSLQRRVALKVIHLQISNEQRLKVRFRREAEAAAGLHHTNIVPVFGNGEDHGLEYYAMQLIDGVTLAQVIGSIRSQHKGSSKDRSDNRATQTSPSWDIDSDAIIAAERLLQDPKQARAMVSQSEQGPALPEKGTALSQQDNLKEKAEADSRQETWSLTQRQLPVERTQKEQIQKPSRKNPVEAEDREANQPTGSTLASEALPNHYYRNVARLTARVANALEYAHRAGVLHRDIKPSNLILDQAGTIWVTDFGLARREELESQTQTGEVLGTLRYMSPEQLQGKGDQRTDIYSLGLTLFELLTLRPALDATKQRLRDPDKYSMVEFSNQEKRFIPRDLQTIVLKATAYVPENRYLRARDFEEDIERFLDDRPILARQQTIAEACVRWSRRNPVIATMAATVFGLLLTIAGLLGLWNRQQRATLGQLKSAYSTAAESLVQRTTALERVELESRRAEHNLELAMEAFHTIVDNISARGRSLDWSSLEGEDIENLGLSDTVLTQADADLLRSLQSFFERFAEENGTDLRLDTALARRRVGEIEAKIGKLDQAIASLTKSIEEFQVLRKNRTDGTDSVDAILIEELKAREALIGLFSRRGQLPKAIGQLDAIRKLMGQYSEFGASPQGKFAFANVLSSISSIEARAMGERLINERRRRPLMPLANRPLIGPLNGPPEIPPQQMARLERDLAINAEAIDILDALSKDEPSQPQYRLVLARNHRDRMRLNRVLGRNTQADQSFDQAKHLLDELLEESPNSAILKYELANLYAGSSIGSPDELKRTNQALEWIRDVLTEHSSVPEYQTLHALLLARSAWVVYNPTEASASVESGLGERPFERIESGVSRLQQAINIHQGLVDRFPDAAIYSMNLLQAKLQLADYYGMARRPERAKQAIAEATATAERMLDAGVAQPLVKPILERLRDRRNLIDGRLDNDKP